MPTFHRDQLLFSYRDVGQGTPFVFQHGLGGDVNQPFNVFSPPNGFRLLAFDCRGHGQTRPVGDESKFTLTAFADDLLALLDVLKLEQVIVGGISMGAAIALNFALRFPQRVMGLVMSRPAWLDGPNEANARIYAQIAQHIRQHGARSGRALFEQTAEYQQMLATSPDCAASLLAQFDHPRAKETVVKLERIPRDCPTGELADVKRIDVPTLILANRQDPIHPFEYAEALAQLIPDAQLRELTPKSVSSTAHAADVQRCITEYLQRCFATKTRG